MSSDNITLVTVCYEGSNRQQSAELVSSIARAQIQSLSTKSELATHVLAGTRLALQSTDLFSIERRSKKHKGYVPLETSADFKEFLRSLKVKNTMKLVVRTKEGVTFQPESSSTMRSLTEIDSGSSPSPGAEAVEQFRRLVTEFQHSEIYEFMKSFAGLYKQVMSPDEMPVEDSNEAPKQIAREEEEETQQSDGTFVGMVHKGVMCDQCSPDPTKSNFIAGLRFKCMVCPDFDLCATCYSQHGDMGKHKANHAMLGIEDSEWFKYFLKNYDSPWAGHFGVPSNIKIKNRSLKSSNVSKEDTEAARKKKNEQRLIQEQAEKYQKLESLLEIEQGSKYDRLVDLIAKGRSYEMQAPRDREAEIQNSESDGKTTDASEEGSSGNEYYNGMIDSSKPLLVEVTVVPKGKFLSQILVTNKCMTIIQGKDLNLNIVNCFDMTVASVLLERKNGFVPKRTSKFNVSVSNTHFKYPFRIVLSSSKYAGSCDLNLKNMSGQVHLVPLSAPMIAEDPTPMMTEDSASKMEDVSTPKMEEDLVEPNVDTHSRLSQVEQESRQMSVSATPSFVTASVHSIVLPSLPKEVQSSVSIDSLQTVTADMDFVMSDDGDGEDEGNEDYDVISVTEAEEDLDSDFEILADQPAA